MFKRYIQSVDFPDQPSGNINYKLDPMLVLNDNYEVAISGGQIVNSVVNVSSAIGNHQFRYSHNAGVDWNIITLPNGSYQTSAFEIEMQKGLKANGHYTVVSSVDTYPIDFIASIYLNRIQMILNANYQVDFTFGTLNALFGFNSQIYSGGGSGATFTAPNIAKFTEPSNNYFITCDIIDEGIYVSNNLKTGVLKVVPGGIPGYALSLKETNGVYDYFRVIKKNITNINIVIYDNLGRIADFQGEPVNIELHFRPIKIF